MAPCPILWRVPNMPATPNRTVRVPDDLWEAVKRKAADRGETVHRRDPPGTAALPARLRRLAEQRGHRFHRVAVHHRVAVDVVAVGDLH